MHRAAGGAVTAAPAPAADPGQAVRPGIVLAVCSLSVFLGGLDSTIVTIGLPADRPVPARRGQRPAVGRRRLHRHARLPADVLRRRSPTGTAAGRSSRPACRCSSSAPGCAALAPSLGCLIAFRVLQGAGASAMNPAALGIVTNVLP